jgi:hypothetical protein
MGKIRNADMFSGDLEVKRQLVVGVVLKQTLKKEIVRMCK